MHRPPTGLRRLTRTLRRAFTPHRRAVIVRVLLNSAPHSLLHGYTPAPPLILAYEYTIPVGGAPADAVILERPFAAFNGHPERPDDNAHANAWADKRLRSLSVGDVIAIDDRHYACQSVEWTRITAPA
ncbi:hypothetical protein OH799_01315 [Nocardia sp. NBC_00881]|uniref:hypothetical protein n=1 Tax=Nocardia sp. NBC_00881 TaxID=2975995 RepID=UPI0038633195|nr:hypothetical protein OH799_01315 [Nocardia sp. NBC_00881]